MAVKNWESWQEHGKKVYGLSGSESHLFYNLTVYLQDTESRISTMMMWNFFFLDKKVQSWLHCNLDSSKDYEWCGTILLTSLVWMLSQKIIQNCMKQLNWRPPKTNSFVARRRIWTQDLQVTSAGLVYLEVNVHLL